MQAAQPTCQRCGATREVKKRSWFDNTPICAKCSVQEKGCPNFQKVHLAGLTALQAGFEIPVIGLAAADIEYLNAVAPKWVPSRRSGQDYEPEYEGEYED